MSAPKILPLPPSVASRILSALTIPTLPTVLSELLQNSLDAAATQITITANLRRHACAVSDDGHGIPPDSIPLVGEAYCTSKHAAGKLGFRGQALAAISRHAVVTVVSRCEGYGRTYVRKIAFGREVHIGVEEDARLLRPGTAVRVEGLWADMPVRSAARPVGDAAVEREWEEVKDVVARWVVGSGVAVVVRDETGRRRMAVTAVEELAALRQVYGAEVDVGWERVRARQGGVSVSGWMAKSGSASKGFQYLYVNRHPLPPGTTLLHAEINKLFAASSFGAVRDAARGKKSADRWGMFILRIECCQRDPYLVGGEGGTDGKAGLEGDNLTYAIDLLQKLVQEFLKAHHFCPMASDGSSRPPLGTVRQSANIPPPPVRRSSSGDLAMLAGWSRVKSARVDPKEEAGRRVTGWSGKEPTRSRRSSSAGVGDGVVGEGEDEFLDWTNPVSNMAYKVNARTGNTVLLKRPASAGPSCPAGQKRVRIVGDQGERPGAWVENLLKNWENPVFKPTDRPIPQTATTFTPHGTKLTKVALCTAQVIAQVDSKFILIKMSGTTTTNTPLLVLIDQHAADERVRVETLFERLFSEPPVPCDPPLTFKVLPREAGLLARHVHTFKRWKIGYKVSSQDTISVTELPAVISPRCHADPPLLVDTLRRHLETISSSSSSSSSSSASTPTQRTWTAGLHECPKGICELLASRACRSAIMFGDDLTKQECQVLVEKLAKCAFPFGCAHGRPVMVPVVDLGDE